MAGNPNPSFSLSVNTTGLAPAPQGGGNTPLIIGWTQSGAFSGSPGVGLYSIANLQTLTTNLGSYGNAVDAAALDLAVGASGVLVYKAFSGSIGSSAYASLTVPSTTGGDGIILTANEEGTAGNSITFHLIISGGGSAAVLSGTSTAIVLTCGSGCTNNTAIAAITGTAVTATLLGGGTDDVVAFSIANLTGGLGGHTGTGTGEIAQSGNPTAPFGSGQAGSGLLVQIATSSVTATTYGTFQYSLDGGNTYSSPIAIPASAGTYSPTGTGITLTFTGAETNGVWVAGDTYSNPITAASGKMYGYGQTAAVSPPGQGLVLLHTSSTGATTYTGEGTFANNSGNPLDNFNVVIQITASGSNTTAQYSYSLDGGITFSPVQQMAATITLAGGVLLSAASTGDSGGSVSGFVQGELYSFQTQGPQLVPGDITNILASLHGNSNTWGWIHIAQQANTVNTSASGGGFELSTLFTDVDTSVGSLFNAGQYVGAWALIDSPPDTAQTNIDSTLETWAATAASNYITVGTGSAAATVSPANGWQLARGSSWDVSARACVAPIGQDLAWVAAGPLVGISKIYRNEANTPGLGPAGFAPLTTIAGLQGFYIANANILCANSSDISLAQYRRVINAACQATRSALINFLSQGVRLTGTGTIDPRDIANIQNTTLASVLSAINGQASGASISVNNTLGAGGVLYVTVSVEPFGYIKGISVTVGFQNPALSAQAA